MATNVVFNQDVDFIELGEGVRRKVLAHNEDIMIVEVHMQKGGQAAVHSHPHVQSSYIRSGRFCFEVEGEKVEVATGDTLAFPPNQPHGMTCLEDGIALDIFTPMRKDFV